MPSAITIRRRARQKTARKPTGAAKKPAKVSLKVFLPDGALLKTARVKQMIFKNPKFEKDPLKFFSEVNRTVKDLAHASGPHGIKVNFMVPESIKESGGPAKARMVLADITNARSMLAVKGKVAETYSEAVFEEAVLHSNSLLELRENLHKLLKDPVSLRTAISRARLKFSKSGRRPARRSA